MWAIYLVAACFFVAIMAIGYFAMQEAEAAREPDAARRASGVAVPACALCDAPLPVRAATSDQVVFEIEHRIDAELRDIVHALRAHPESVGRLLNG